MNPIDNKNASQEFNSKSMKDMEYNLIMHRYRYFKVGEKYGEDEKSIIILNIVLIDLKHLTNEFRQEAFIYAKKVYTKNGTPFFFYEMYEVVGYQNKGKKEKEYKYKAKGIGEKVKNAQNLKDFFSTIKKFKFQIDFLFLEKALQHLYLSL